MAQELFAVTWSYQHCYDDHLMAVFSSRHLAERFIKTVKRYQATEPREGLYDTEAEDLAAWERWEKNHPAGFDLTGKELRIKERAIPLDPETMEPYREDATSDD